MLILLLLAVWTSPLAAGPGDQGLELAIPETLAPSWQRILADHPLPDGLEIVDQAGGGRLSMKLVRGGAAPGSGTWKMVERTFFAPVGRLGEADRGMGATLPLEQIRLPLVALPVDGLFPDQPGYPLVEEVALGIESSDPSVIAWYESIAEAPPLGQARAILWIGAVGDIMPARGVDALLQRPDGLERVFGDTLPLLASCGILLGNLEGAATRRGEKAAKTYTFRFDPAALAKLAEAGFTHLSLANNHSFDFGEAGFLDTLEALERVGIAAPGAGRNLAEARSATEIAAAGMTVRVLSFGAYPVDRMGFDGRRTATATAARPGILWLDEESLAAAALQLGPDSFDIAMVHGGEEWSSEPTAGQKRLYRRLIDAGADLVVGSHPHVLQGTEAAGGGLIAYSLGNFLFPGMEGTKGGEDSAILRVGVYRGAIRYVQAYPVWLSGTTVRRQVAEPAPSGVPPMGVP
ncbi:MAG: CapA family protein [Spirochaetes bacterium]|nr:CapA family protein [Spirochaetota bacterium]